MLKSFPEAVVNRPPEAGGGALLPAWGSLQGTSVPELLSLASRQRLNGSLVFKGPTSQKVVYFREGLVAFASSSDPEDRLGNLLLRRGEVGLIQLRNASRELTRGRRIGQILIDEGVVGREVVARAVLDQVRAIVLSILPWRNASWQVSRVALPSDEPLTLDVPVERLILSGMRRIRDWKWIRTKVGGPRAVYRAIPESERPDLPMGPVETALLSRLDESMRVDGLCRDVFAPSLDVYRSLWALSLVGAVKRVDSREILERGDASREGRLEDRGGAPRVMLDLGAREFTGVLRIFASPLEGSLYFKNGRVTFGTTNDTEKSLIAHLLRRGVISDRDQEETVRKLISGKRIGALLAERGAIDAEELGRFVREQIFDVAKSLALVDAGEFEIDDEAPHDEEVELDRSVEEVILSAFETSERFQPIWDRLGDENVLFRLAPGYLPQLDRLQMRTPVWELVSLLGQERTLEEILSARPEHDADLCRLLAALELIGVVTRVSQTEILERARRSQESDSELASTASETAESEVSDEAVSESAPVEERSETESEEGDAAEVAASTAAELAPELFSPRDDEGPQSGAVETDEPSEEAPSGTATGEEHDSVEIPVEGGDAETEVDVAVSEPSESVEEAEASDVSEIAGEAPVQEEAEASDDTSDFELDAQGAHRDGPVVTHGFSAAAEEAPSGLELAEESSGDSRDAPVDGGWTGWDDVSASGDDEEPAAPDCEFKAADDEAEVAALEEATSGGEASGSFELDESDSEPGPESVALVERFNDRHARLFAELRQEIGAGVVNYVATCRRRLRDGGLVFGDLSPDREGRFPVADLARRIDAESAGEPELEALIATELEMVRDFLSPHRIAEIEGRLEESGD